MGAPNKRQRGVYAALNLSASPVGVRKLVN
jgi:hypothetical protein